MPPAPERSVVESTETEHFVLPQEVTVPVEEAAVPPLRTETEEVFAAVEEDTVQPEDADDAYTSPLPSLSSLKNLLKRGHHVKEQSQEEPEDEGEDDLLSAISALAVEEDGEEEQESLFTPASVDETRVINLDDLQFGRNYNRED